MGRHCHSLKKRVRLADSGIWNPHCHPSGVCRSSVGTLGLSLLPSTAGQVETMFWMPGLESSALIKTRDDMLPYLSCVCPSDARVSGAKIDGDDDSPLVHDHDGYCNSVFAQSTAGLSALYVSECRLVMTSELSNSCRHFHDL